MGIVHAFDFIHKFTLGIKHQGPFWLPNIVRGSFVKKKKWGLREANLNLMAFCQRYQNLCIILGLWVPIILLLHSNPNSNVMRRTPVPSNLGGRRIKLDGATRRTTRDLCAVPRWHLLSPRWQQNWHPCLNFPYPLELSLSQVPPPFPAREDKTGGGGDSKLIVVSLMIIQPSNSDAARIGALGAAAAACRKLLLCSHCHRLE